MGPCIPKLDSGQI